MFFIPVGYRSRQQADKDTRGGDQQTPGVQLSLRRSLPEEPLPRHDGPASPIRYTGAISIRLTPARTH